MPCAPAPSTGFTITGYPTSLTKLTSSFAVDTSAMRAQGTPRARKNCFICRLSRQRVVCPTESPGMLASRRTSAAVYINASIVHSSLWTHGPRAWILRTASSTAVVLAVDATCS